MTDLTNAIQLASLKLSIESKHWTWRCDRNDPKTMAINAKNQPFTFRIYAGPYVKIAHNQSELDAAREAVDMMCTVLEKERVRKEGGK